MSPAGFVVLVVAGTRDPNMTTALVDALSAALAPEGFVVRDGATADPGSDERVDGQARAAGRVLIEWDGSRGHAARVRVQRTGNPRAVERWIEFAAHDPPRERARLVGLVAGAIWSAIGNAPIGTGVEIAHPAVPAIPLTPAVAATSDGQEARIRAPGGNLAVDVAAVVTTGVGGQAGRWGASLAGSWRPGGGRFGWRAGLDARAGEIPAALATVYTLVATLGGKVAVLEPRPGRPVGLELRAELLAVGEIVSHLSSDDRTAVRRQRWLPGASGACDLTWSISTSLAALLGTGVEVVGGATDVVVREEKTATISAWRLVARAGLRTRF